jgi:hypothetical protein
MNVAHIVGEHQSENSFTLVSHLLTSWAGLVIAATIVAIALHVLYRKFRPAPRLDKINK